MSIANPTGPTEGRDVVFSALSTRTSAVDGFLSLGRGIRVGAPLPVYQVGLSDLNGEQWSSKVRLVAWRYPLVGEDGVGLADVKGAQGTAYLTNIHAGPSVDRFWKASLLAEKELASYSETFGVRILEIPALRIAALWLVGTTGRTFFVPFIDGCRPTGLLNVEPDLNSRIHDAKSHLLSRRKLSRRNLKKMRKLRLR